MDRSDFAQRTDGWWGFFVKENLVPVVLSEFGMAQDPGWTKTQIWTTRQNGDLCRKAVKNQIVQMLFDDTFFWGGYGGNHLVKYGGHAHIPWWVTCS